MHYSNIHCFGLKNVIYEEAIILHFPKTLGGILWMIMKQLMMLNNIYKN
eukprot:UN03612